MVLNYQVYQILKLKGEKFMSAKVKLISFISAFVLVLGIMIIGVLSAEQVKVNIGGSVSFNATNVYARVSGDISGAGSGNKTFSTLTYSASETTGDESDWTNLALEFTETPDPIEITITVENLSTQRTLTANLTNSLSASGLNIAVTRDSGAYASGTNFDLPASTGDGSSTTTFTLSLTVANPNEDLTNVTFGYILNLFDENYTPPPTPASSFRFSYSDTDHTASITDFVGNETEIVIPVTVNKLTDTTATEGSDYTVTSIGNNALYNCSSLTSITIPDTVTSIGNYAFQSCSSLTSITIPDTVTSIGEEAFDSCDNLAMVNFGENSQLTSIGEEAFRYCSSLTSITIPDTVTSIGEYAFRYCSSLTSITIPDTVTSISEGAFYGCSSLTSITIPEGVTSIGLCAFMGCSSLSSITIPDSVNYIAYETFYSCSSLTSITIPSSVTSIGEEAFKGCSSLSSITIGESITRIGNSAFSSCYALAEVYNYSNLKVMAGGSGNGYLGYYAKVVYNASDLTGEKPATRIKDNNGVRYYDDGENTVVALYPLSKDITTVSLDSRTTEIQLGAFSNCNNLTSVDFGENSQLTSIGNSAFSSCYSLTSITILDSVTSIGSGAFQSCRSLTSVDFGENSQLTSIGTFAFSGCSSLTSITIPSSVTSIGSSAFNLCSSLTSITINATEPPTFGSSAIPSNVTNIYVPAESVEAYKEAGGWKSYSSKISAIV